MKILPIRTIEDDVFTVELKPSEFGTTTATAEEEIEMLHNFPQTLRYADITFADKFVVTNGNPTISTDESAVEVSLDLNNKEFKVDENLDITMSFDANKLSDTVLDETVLTTKQLYAQAQAILFETKVKAKIHELLEVARGNVNDFETTVEETL